MSIIEGIGDEVTNFFIILITSVILYLVWTSTNVRDERMSHAPLLIIETNRRRFNNPRDPVNQRSNLRNSNRRRRTFTTIIHPNGVTDTDEFDLDEARRTVRPEIDIPGLEAILDSIQPLSIGYRLSSRLTEHLNTGARSSIDSGPEEIIFEMDHDNDNLRHRRNVAATTSTSTVVTTPTPSTSSDAAIDHSILNVNTDNRTNTENCSNENCENGNVIEENINSSTPPIDSPTQTTATIKTKKNNITNEFRIKLKYLNDELKLVTGNPMEAIGDFKNRNFSDELAAQKLVRLVFNGHVLQPDTKTLQACGLFDNCVVHCLIHTRTVENAASESRRQALNEYEQIRSSGLRYGQISLFLIMAIFIICLICCWCFRANYTHLFSWYSTAGLTIITFVFIVVVPIIFLIERDVVVGSASTTNG